jgi:DNA-3-methyladenine glycosylase II
MTNNRHGINLTPTIITKESLAFGLQYLSERDEDLASILNDFGPPQLWFRKQGFATLVQIMLEQQVSLASAKAVFDRLLVMASPLTPHRFMELDDASLKSVGFSWQKIAYVRDLAEAIMAGRLRLNDLGRLPDADVKAELLKIKGIGNWTADIYLLRALRRPDAWPGGDLALAIATEKVKRLPLRPTPDELDAISEAWRPWRAVAARLLWQYYLNSSATRRPPKRTAFVTGS